MQNRRLLVVGLALMLSLTLVTGVMGSGSPMMVRDVASSGGEVVAAGDFVLLGTLGESLANESMAADNVQTSTGFLAGLPPDVEIFLPFISD